MLFANGSKFVVIFRREFVSFGSTLSHSDLLGDASHLPIIELCLSTTFLVCFLIRMLGQLIFVAHKVLRHFLEGSIILILLRDLVEVGALKALLGDHIELVPFLIVFYLFTA